MNGYKIDIEKKAEKFIRKQPKNQQERLIKAIYKLPYEGDIASVEGRKGYLRLKIGGYRVIFTVNNGAYIVKVIDADNRGQIYKRY